MSINTIEYAKIFMEALDEQLVAGATSGWMEENSGQVQYTGGNEVKIPKIELNGLGTYDRDNGFVQGAVTLTYETKQMTQDSPPLWPRTRWMRFPSLSQMQRRL